MPWCELKVEAAAGPVVGAAHYAASAEGTRTTRRGVEVGVQAAAPCGDLRASDAVTSRRMSCGAGNHVPVVVEGEAVAADRVRGHLVAGHRRDELRPCGRDHLDTEPAAVARIGIEHLWLHAVRLQPLDHAERLVLIRRRGDHVVVGQELRARRIAARLDEMHAVADPLVSICSVGVEGRLQLTPNVVQMLPQLHAAASSGRGAGRPEAGAVAGWRRSFPAARRRWR